jgi:hypothetical protein
MDPSSRPLASVGRSRARRRGGGAARGVDRAPEDRRRIREAGFARHFVKPIDPVLFARSIAGLWP